MSNPWDDAPIAEEVLPIAEEVAPSNPWDNAPVAEEQSTQEVGPYVKDFSSGAYEGIANMLGAPVDLVSAAISPFLGEIKGIGGSESIKSGMENIGLIDEQQSKGALGRGARRVGQEVGAMILPTAGILKAASKIKPVLIGTKSMLRNLFLEPVAKAPLSTTVGEFTAGVGAGIGASVAHEKSGSQTAEITGQIIGGVTPSILNALSPTAWGLKLLKKVAGRFSPEAQKNIALKQIKEVLGDELTPEVQKKIKQVGELQEKMKEKGIDWNPTLGEITDSPAILRQQKQLEENASGAYLEQLIQRAKDNETAINDYISSKTPGSDVDSQYIVDIAKNRIDTIGIDIDTAISGVNMTKKDILDNIIPIDRMASGKAIRDGINKARGEASTKMSLRAQELNIADIDLTEPFDKFRNELIEKYRPTSRFSDKKALPEIYKSLKKEAEIDIPEEGVPELNLPEAEKLPTSFNDIKSLRERITDDLRNETGSAIPNRKKQRILVLMKKDVDNFLEEMEPILGENYKQFRKEYFEDFITPFESGAIFKTRNKDGTGFYKTNNEKIASVFLDNPSAAKQYNDIFESNPEMMLAMKSAAIDDMKRAAVEDGVLSTRKLKIWAKRRNESIEQIPGLKEDVSDITVAHQQLDNRERQLFARKKDIENKSLSKKLRKYGKGDISSVNIIDSAIKNPVEMRRLKSYIKKDEEAMDGLKRIIWGKATEGSAEDTVKFMAIHAKTLMEIFPKSQLKDMYDISVMKSIVDRTTIPSGSAIKNTELPDILKKVEEITGMKVPQFGTRLYAYQSGRVPKHYLMLEAAMTALRKNASRYSDKLWSEALYDPKTTKLLIENITSGKIAEKNLRRIGSRVAILGLPYTEEEKINGN